jgi:hypothetical protein
MMISLPCKLSLSLKKSQIRNKLKMCGFLISSLYIKKFQFNKLYNDNRWNQLNLKFWHEKWIFSVCFRNFMIFLHILLLMNCWFKWTLIEKSFFSVSHRTIFVLFFFILRWTFCEEGEIFVIKARSMCKLRILVIHVQRNSNFTHLLLNSLIQMKIIG